MQNDVSWGGPVDERNRRALQRIADLLGCSVEELRKGNGLGQEPGQTAELLRLWFTIHDDPTRLAILGHMRRMAREQGSPPV